LPIRSDRQRKESILVADQDQRVLELLQITLSGRGYAVRTAADGVEALEEIDRAQPDLAVVGVRLARKSGLQVLEAVRAESRTARMPVILIAGTASNESRIQGLRLGADDYLVKPFSPRELMIKIRTILDRAADLRLLQLRHRALREEARRQGEELLRAREEMGRYLARIGGLLRRVEELGQEPDLAAVLARLVAACSHELELARVCVLVHGKGGDALRARAWQGIEEAIVRPLRLAAGDFLCQTLRLEGRTMGADEFSGYPLAADDLLKLSAAGLTHVTPVLSPQRELIAVVAGGEKWSGEAIDRFDLHLLDLLARAAAGAIREAEDSAAERRAFVDTAAQLIAVVEGRYEHLRGHSARVHDLSLRLADELSLPARRRETVGYVAWLHDLGALEQYAQLQEEARRLSDGERLDLRRRGSAAVRRLLESSGLPEVAEALGHLHEYWDGHGVPDGLAGESIPLAARVVALANAYDALTHERPHRPAYAPAEALALLHERGGSRYDPSLVRAFEKVLGIEAEPEGAQSLTMPTMRGPASRSK